jgi:hypothetical protein
MGGDNKNKRGQTRTADAISTKETRKNRLPKKKKKSGGGGKAKKRGH